MFAYLWQRNITLFVTLNVVPKTWQLKDMMDDQLIFLLVPSTDSPSFKPYPFERL